MPTIINYASRCCVSVVNLLCNNGEIICKYGVEFFFVC